MDIESESALPLLSLGGSSAGYSISQPIWFTCGRHLLLAGGSGAVLDKHFACGRAKKDNSCSAGRCQLNLSSHLLDCDCADLVRDKPSLSLAA